MRQPHVLGTIVGHETCPSQVDGGGWRRRALPISRERRRHLSSKEGDARSGCPRLPTESTHGNFPFLGRTRGRPTFVVGTFRSAAQLFDRMTTEVLISEHDRDDFIKNMLTVRAEER